MEIRPARPTDREELHRLRVLLWPESDAAMLREDLDAMDLDGPRGVMRVAERPGGGLAGLLEVGVRGYAEGCETSPVAYLEGWVVDEDCRRTGIGRRLVEAAEAWARVAGFQEIASDAELWNEGRQAAHQALGYQEEVRQVCFRKRLG